MNSFFSKKIVLITGASSGIGASLASELAGRGATLALCARRLEMLSAVQKSCEARGATVRVYQCDVTDDTQVQKTVEEIKHQLGPIDVVVANAGFSGAFKAKRFQIDLANKIMDVNVKGVINTIGAVVPDMCTRGRGSIVAVSSLASYMALPQSYVYGASKSAVSALLQGLRRELVNTDIKVITICPGFIKSEMTAVNKFKMPFLMDAEPAAKRMADAIARGDAVYNFPRRLFWIIKLASWLPDKILAMPFQSGKPLK